MSHFTEMGMPDHPIDGLGMNCTAQPPPPEPCKKIVTDGRSLVNYYQNYARTLPSERMMIGKVVSASLKGSVWQDGLFWDVKIQGQEKKEWCVESENLLLAIGRTQPNWLNIPGEKQNPYVSHWTHDACRSMACLQAGGSILVVGDGFSACDTIWEAWQKGLTVTHLLPSWVRDEAVRVGKAGGSGRHGLIQHLNYRQSERHYKVARAMAFPEECAAFYRQGVDCRLVRIINGRECFIEKHKDGKVVQHDKIMFDHIALLTGAKADYSFLPDAIKSSLFCSNGALDVCPETMESRSCRNLFLLGFCAGEAFLRHTFGHAISAVETIRGRERVRQMGDCRRNRIESMECG
ncbi:FAD-dependent oxidoreductase [Endozoicomonas ascidiicola]|uniref:FAD-dependent oxidoreductase n=1 Tax=Endozoicomonas ascidiicola TaxID=1698521 RepID=UPI0012FA8E73|nr:FAD-dependent oxidoreductase [Endozoicomonas ascidiicola]